MSRAPEARLDLARTEPTPGGTAGPTVSVVLPTYNRLTLLREAAASVAAQSVRPHEVIVVDDGSTDGTRAWLEEEAARGRLKAVFQENSGPSAARNAGAAAASGEWVAFLDSDDLWFPWSLEAITTVLAAHPGIGAMALAFVEFSGSHCDVGTAAPVDADLHPDYFASSRRGYFAGGGMWVFRREAFAAAGGFDTSLRYAEDHDLALRLGAEPGFAMLRTPAIVSHRRHAQQLSQGLTGILAGVAALVARERAGRYPGGATRARERRRIIGRHVRPIVLAAVGAGRLAEAWTLYRETILWHAAERRLGFLVAAPLLAARRRLRRPAYAP